MAAHRPSHQPSPEEPGVSTRPVRTVKRVSAPTAAPMRVEALGSLSRRTVGGISIAAATFGHRGSIWDCIACESACSI